MRCSAAAQEKRVIVATAAVLAINVLRSIAPPWSVLFFALLKNTNQHQLSPSARESVLPVESENKFRPSLYPETTFRQKNGDYASAPELFLRILRQSRLKACVAALRTRHRRRIDCCRRFP